MGKSLIAVPIGDPAGVGPEIVAKSVASKEVFDAADCIIVGDKTIMENAIQITGANLTVHVINEPGEGDFREGILNLIDLKNVDMDQFEFGRVNGMCGKAAYAYMPWQPRRSTRSRCAQAISILSDIRRSLAP